MKKTVLVIALFGISYFANAQDASVEESTTGIQTGFLGIWVHNEYKLSNKIVLRSEIGLDAGFFGGAFRPENGYLFTPVATLEPRWYYNLNKRASKSKSVDGNAGNFVSIKTSFHPDWFVISNIDYVSIDNQISIVPTWGIRRNIGSHFTYETGIGIGYRHYFSDELQDQDELAVNLHLRIGYKFN